MQPVATFQQPLTLSGDHEKIRNQAFILATGFGDSPFHGFHAFAKASGWTTMTFDCGHDVMLDRPGELLDALLMIAAGGVVAS
jgi:hypothetical protein